MSDILIATAVDGNLVPQLKVMLRSIARNTLRPIKLFLLCRDLEPNELYDLDNFTDYEGIELHIFDMSRTRPIIHQLPSYITVSAMDRLHLPDLLPNINKILYLDVDLIAVDDIGELYDHDPEILMAKEVINPKFRTFRNAIRWWYDASTRKSIFETLQRRIGDTDWQLFNSGVMLLNLEHMRDGNFVDWVYRTAPDYAFNDNLMMSFYARDDFARMDPRWNVFPGQDHEQIENRGIIHWVGKNKPWHDHPVIMKSWWQFYDLNDHPTLDYKGSRSGFTQ